MKRFVIYPFLFVLAYIFSRVVSIRDQIDSAEIIRPLIVSIIFSSVILVLLSIILKDNHRSGFIFTLLMLIMFFYGEIYANIATLIGTKSNVLALVVFIVLLCLFYLGASNRVWRLFKFPELATYYLNIVFIFLLLFQVIQVSTILYKLIEKRVTNVPVRFSPQSLKLSDDVRPDIYIIVLDAYARADVLENIYHYDDTNFLSALEERGFYIARQTHSNYVLTKQALGSLLNLDYIPPLEPSNDYFSYYHSIIANNSVFSSLKQIGYKTVTFDTGFTFSKISSADFYFSNYLPLNNFETYLLMGTPVEMLSNVFGLKIPTYTYQSHRERVLYIFKNLQNVPNLPGSKIVFAHILSPHPPFIFDQNGQSIEPDGPYQMFDGSGSQGKKEDYQRGYRNQVAFVNKQVLETVDAILKKSKTPPVILLMGDHGPGSMFNINSQHPGCLWERTSNLVALLLPNHLSDPRLYRSISSVNSIRLIFDLYFNANLPLLEDKTFLTSDSEPYAMKDITQDVSSSPQSCSTQDAVP